MAVTRLPGRLWMCLSTDTKPSAADGDALIESDTAKTFYRSSGTWLEPLGGQGGTVVETHVPLVSLMVAQTI